MPPQPFMFKRNVTHKPPYKDQMSFIENYQNFESAANNSPYHTKNSGAGGGL